MPKITESSNDINTRAKNISNELYVFCNFEENNLPTISAEGEFYKKILLLYNALHDSSIFLQTVEKIVVCYTRKDEREKLKREQKFQEYNNLYSIIMELRAFLAHNNSENNGYKDQQRISFFTSWVSQLCGKPIPLQLDDFKKLSACLDKYDERLYHWINSVLSYISISQKKNEIIDNWKCEIIKWYAIKKDFFYDQLIGIYVAMNLRKTNGVVQNPEKYVLDIWIQNSLYEKEYNEFQKAKRQFSLAMLKSKKSKASTITEWHQKNIQEQKNKLQSFIIEICRYFKKDPRHIDKLPNECFVQYFFNVKLEQHIKELLEEKKCSLLPNDILQEVIKSRFINSTYTEAVELCSLEEI